MMINVRFIPLLLLCFYALSGCTSLSTISEQEASQKNDEDILVSILVDADSVMPIRIAADDLKQDIISTTGEVNISISNAANPLPDADFYLVLGQIEALSRSPVLTEEVKRYLSDENPGDRGSILLSTSINGKDTVVLSGSDVQGTQYAAYEYSHRVLGIDPLAYWTDKQVKPKSVEQIFEITKQVIPPPVVPLLVYFENDTDELINLKPPMLEYDWESFTEMIDALVRLKYNGIEMFDMLGRVEFYTRQSYTERYPGYQLNVPYLDKMMQYVHDKGMYIQIDMMQGRQLRTLSTEASTCWTDHKQEYIDGWRYYLTETPIKNIDIFALRPRNQVWDWSYKSTCGEDRVTVFNEMFAEFDKIVEEFKPGAPKVCICYSDGMQLFNDGFRPPEDFIIVWSDDGFGRFKYMPVGTFGYKFGTYMHAGYWKNHDVMDPYPLLVDEIMDMMYETYDARHYMEVNGQTFRPFLLNIEAYAESANLGIAFDGEQFYQQWVTRYFGEAASDEVIKALTYLHEAHSGKMGYVEILWQVKNMQAYLADVVVTHPGKEDFKASYESIEVFFEDTQPRIDSLLAALTHVETAKPLIEEKHTFFHDHVELPIRIYLDLLNYNQTLIDLVKHTTSTGDEIIDNTQLQTLLEQGKHQLDTIYERRINGDINPKWATWYEPSKRRPNNGFPTQEDYELILKNLQ